jgi:protein-S-isoprenylcysteine O-methyltransferase Ste14
MKLRRLPRGIPLLLVMAALAVFSSPRDWTLVSGGALALLGLLVRTWAAGHLRRNEELATSGPYAYVRDPLYLGRFLILIGLCLMAWLWSGPVVLALGLGVFFFDYMPRKHRKEMARLEKFFGERYRKYAAEVRSLVPRLTRWPDADRRPWSAQLYFRENREQWFILVVLACATGIVTRYLLSGDVVNL